MKQLLYRYEEAARTLGVSVARIRQLVELGELQRVFLGKGSQLPRVTAESLEEYRIRKLGQ